MCRNKCTIGEEENHLMKSNLISAALEIKYAKEFTSNSHSRRVIQSLCQFFLLVFNDATRKLAKGISKLVGSAHLCISFGLKQFSALTTTVNAANLEFS